MHPIYTYAMAFAASLLLVELSEKEDSYVKYWQLLRDRSTWQQAFHEAFGMGIEEFYRAFEDWLPPRLGRSAAATLHPLSGDEQQGPAGDVAERALRCRGPGSGRGPSCRGRGRLLRHRRRRDPFLQDGDHR